MLDSPTTVLAGAPLQNRASDLSPGIIGLLVQGIEIAMVFSQLATWLSLPGRTKHRFITILTVFITAVGLWALFSPLPPSFPPSSFAKRTNGYSRYLLLDDIRKAPWRTGVWNRQCLIGWL